MSSLKKLTVAMNELTDLPPDVWDVKLDHLNLRNNEIVGTISIDVPPFHWTLIGLSLGLHWTRIGLALDFPLSNCVIVTTGELPVEIIKLRDTLVELCKQQ